jgi:transaldolase
MRSLAMKSAAALKIKIFADGADKNDILALYQNPLVKGFTTNPSLLYQAGVRHYEAFARDILSFIPDKPISFEVLSDNFAEMKAQALKIASWGENVYVKIPVTNTQGKSSLDLIRDLANRGVKQNVTAIMTLEQTEGVIKALTGCQAAIISVFAGRIADTGIDPVPMMEHIAHLLAAHSQLELLWASSREVLNIFQAEAIGCQIITVTPALLNKLHLIGKDLPEFSLETVKMFYQDAIKAGLSLTLNDDNVITAS